MTTRAEAIHIPLCHGMSRGETIVQATTSQAQVAPDLDAKGLLLRDALAILTVVGALVAFYGMIKLVSYLSGIPFP